MIENDLYSLNDNEEKYRFFSLFYMIGYKKLNLISLQWFLDKA